MDDDLAQIRKRRLEEILRLQGELLGGGGGGAKAEPAVVDMDTIGAFLENQPIALVDVWAAWCGPCRMMEPIVEELAHELQGRAGVAKLNADENPDFLAQYGIQGIPTFLFFRDGKLAGRMVGARPKRDFLEVVRQLESARTPEEPDVA